MAISPLIDGHAPGYWGRDIRARIKAEFVPEKVTSLNLDKISAMGLPFALWREADSFIDNLQRCSCFKDTARQPDIPCQTCYGTGFVPGYLKFGTQNYWMASIETGWQLSGIVLDNNNRPFRFMLDGTQTSGVALSPLIYIDISQKIGPWESKVEGFTRDGGVDSSITVEVSPDAGITWYPLSALESLFPSIEGSNLPIILSPRLPIINGPSLPLLFTRGPQLGIRFRVTMKRGSIKTKTPMFEIVRTRFQTMRDVATINPLSEAVIRAIPTWLNEAEIKQVFGAKFESNGRRFWTMPLTFFDTSMSRETELARVGDDAIVEIRYGGETGFRYRLVDFSYSDTFGEFTRQEFALRKFAGQPGEIKGELAYKIF